MRAAIVARAIALLAVSGGLGSCSPAGGWGKDPEAKTAPNARWVMEVVPFRGPTDAGEPKVWRMDTQTGAVALCKANAIYSTYCGPPAFPANTYYDPLADLKK